MDCSNLKLTPNTPMAISQVMSKLLEKLLNSSENIDNSPEFKLLREKCAYGNDSLDWVAGQAILQLLEKDKITSKLFLPDILTMFTTTKCSSSVVSLVTKLLATDLRKEKTKDVNYTSPYNLLLPQHPLIKLLKEDPNIWLTIYEEIEDQYRTVNEGHDLNDLYKPLVMFILCGPYDPKLVTFKEKLWTLFIKKCDPDYYEQMHYFITWMLFEQGENVKFNSDLLIIMGELDYQQENDWIVEPNMLLMLQASSLYRLLLNHYNAKPMLNSITELLVSCDPEKLFLKPVLLIMTKIIYVSSSVHLLDLFKIYRDLIVSFMKNCDLITRHVFMASLLQWTGNPSVLTSEATKVAEEIILTVKNVDRTQVWTVNKVHKKFTEENQKLIQSNDDVYIASQLSILLDNIDSTQDLSRWIRKLKDAPDFFLTKISHVLFGIFLLSFEEENREYEVLELVKRVVSYDRRLSSYFVTLCLHKLTKTRHSEMHLKLFRLLCTLSENRECVPKILSIFHAVAKGSSTLHVFVTSLMLDLWKVNSNCYTHLEKFIVTPYQTVNGNKWEFYATRANVLKEICAIKPELHGKDMVPHISKILNECSSPEGALASSLAIDAITLLCRFDIIDAVTTWNSLAPMLQNDTRVSVIRSVCLFVKEISTMTYTEALLDQLALKLWSYINSTTDLEIWEAALNSLSAFKHETILANMPEVYLNEEMLTLKSTGSNLTGECWILFLKNAPQSMHSLVSEFFARMINAEIESLLKFVYQVKGPREPPEYSTLAPNLVLRGLPTYVSSKERDWKRSICPEIYVECLRALSVRYCKPLPPFDWCFLQELIHEKETRYCALEIAAHQVVISGTARRLMVNFVEAMTQEYNKNVKDIILVYRNLPELSKSVQPMTLEPFLKYTIHLAVDTFEKEPDPNLLENIVKYLKLTLEDSNIQEANKSVIADILTNKIEEHDSCSKIFEILVDCLVLFPRQQLSNLTSPKIIGIKSSDSIKKAVMIACCHAKKQTKSPFNLLDEIIQSGHLFSKLKSFFLEQLSMVFIQQMNNTECVLWLLDLIGQIHAMIVEKYDQKSIQFHCDVLTTAVVTFSGHFSFKKNLSNLTKSRKLFPRSLVTLFDVGQWSMCTNQALELFYILSTQDVVNDKQLYIECLQALRHDDEFNKNTKWIKYLNVNK